ncbi:hypothetical protein F5148DRAFT_162616 [Russula earlei]|uniref:Uncharacterized protein n=1 Tax=Russula earlei TaxID=71964 RepID=A0ACC0U7J4_9AGAM|nr:hypothetical protein F5148DRAFT_162616 [Russula earlei]
MNSPIHNHAMYAAICRPTGGHSPSFQIPQILLAIISPRTRVFFLSFSCVFLLFSFALIRSTFEYLTTCSTLSPACALFMCGALLSFLIFFAFSVACAIFTRRSDEVSHQCVRRAAGEFAQEP